MGWVVGGVEVVRGEERGVEKVEEERERSLVSVRPLGW